MIAKVAFLIVGSASVALADNSSPLIQVALAPPEGGASTVASFEHFSKAESALESSGMFSLQTAYSGAVARAKAEIDAAIHGGSFLRKSPAVNIRVMSAPEGSQSMGRIAQVESIRGDIQAKRIAQAAAEFDTISKVVVAELKAALGPKSFLRNDSDLNVKVKASDIPWSSTYDLLQAREMARDSSEMSFDSAVLDMQIKFCKQLNVIIASSLA